MQSKRHVAALITVCFALLLEEVSIAAAPQQVSAERQQFLNDNQRIHALAESRDLDGLERLAVELEAKWSVRKKEEYGYIMLGVCGRFSSLDHEEDRHYDLARQYAKSALEKSGTFEEDDRVPVDVELELLEYVLTGLDLREAAESGDWAKHRADIAKLHFRVWTRLENTIGSFDATNVLEGGPPVPAGVEVWTPWMSPESIKDPELRASYEVELEAYREKARKYYAHLKLRELQEERLPYVQESLLRLYSGPSFNSKKLEKAALKQDLEKHVKNREFEEMIVSKIQQRLEEKSKGGAKDSRRRGRRSRTGTL